MDLKNNLLRLAKNSIVYGGSDVLVRFLNFLLLPLFTAYLTPKDYGISSILGIVLFLFTSLCSFGLGAATGPCYFESSDPKKRGTVIWTSFTILLCGAVVVTGVGWLWSGRISTAAFGFTGHRDLVFLTVLTAALSLLVEPLNLYLRFEERAKIVGGLSILSGMASSAATVGLVMFARRGVLGLVEGCLIGRAVTLVLFLIPTVASLRFSFRRDVAWQLLRLGLPLVPSFACVFLLQHASKFVLQWSRGLDEVGIYQVGINLGMIISIGVMAFQSAWYPFFMSFMDRREDAHVLFGRIFTYYVIGMGTVSLLFFLGARPLVIIMTQKAFGDAYRVVGLAACAQFLQGAFYVLLPGMYFAKEPQCQGVVQAGAAASGVGIAFLLIPALGLLGAAFALVAGYLLLVVLTHVWNKLHRRYLDVVYEWKRIGVFALVYLACAVPTLLARDLPLGWEVGLSACGSGLLVVVITMLLTGGEKRHVVSMTRSVLTSLRLRSKLAM